MVTVYDKIILGAGLYGLYSALYCANKGERILVLEYDDTPFKRATFINQARVHNGYHYPRSLSTALRSASYFNRFNEDYSFSVLCKFDQIYATSANFSWTNAKQFQAFCQVADIKCEEVEPTRFFKEGYCDGAFLTEEYTYDAQILKDFFLEKLSEKLNVKILYSARLSSIDNNGKEYVIEMKDGHKYCSPFVLNATYASVNQLLTMCGFDLFKIKYELCEIILCNVNDKLNDVGLTVMDGPFFSIMPFGRTGYHSLTAVTFTPHIASKDDLPHFNCQARSNGFCSPLQLGNCNECVAKPESAWPYMSQLARKYMRDDLVFSFDHTLYSMKPILMASEIDDSRPTVIKTYSTNPTFISVLSGKINTVYDLNSIL